MHYYKWNKLDSKTYIIYDFIYMTFWKRQHFRDIYRVVFLMGQEWERLTIKWHRELLGLIELPYILTMVVVTWLYVFVKTHRPGCDWCGSVVWVLSHRLKDHWFNSWSGYMPGLQARSLVGCVQEATNWCFSHTSMFLSLSFSLPSPLSKNKIFFKFISTKQKFFLLPFKHCCLRFPLTIPPENKIFLKTHRAVH